MPRITHKRVVIVAVVAVVFLILFGQSIIFHFFPDYAFRQLTGRSVPAGVRITAYASDMSDNLFRSTYYWRLQHEADGYAMLQQGAEFRIYSDDVEGYIAGVRCNLAPLLRSEDISSIRQWSRTSHRSQLILQQRGGLVTYYVLSTL